LEKRKKLTARSEGEKEKLIKRLNIIEGQVRGIKQMISDDRYCEDVITQMLAINKALESLENIILENHLNSCIKTKIEKGNTEDVSKEIMDLFKKLR
jgi:DNA-binding FrmR family transcriptional regulator